MPATASAGALHVLPGLLDNPLEPTPSAHGEALSQGPRKRADEGAYADIVRASRLLIGAWDAAMSRGWLAAAPDSGAHLVAAATASKGSDGVEDDDDPSSIRWGELDELPLHAPARGRASRAAPSPASIAARNAATLPQAGVDSGMVVQMLDGFQVWVGARAVPELPRGKTRSLLKFLLLHRRRPVSRHQLLSLFWPEADARTARNNLNVALHRLRKGLGDMSLLAYANDAYQLQTNGAAWIDTEQFLAHADEAREAQAKGLRALAVRQYETAATLYCNDLIDAGEQESALQMDAQALRDRFNEVLDSLSDLHEHAGDHHACLRAALRHLQLDDCNEVAHQRLMRCYARLGQPQLAEMQYRHCMTSLRMHLGLNPSGETTQLYRRISRRESI